MKEIARDSYIFSGGCKECGLSVPVNKYHICHRCDVLSDEERKPVQIHKSKTGKTTEYFIDDDLVCCQCQSTEDVVIDEKGREICTDCLFYEQTMK